jgi:hypothetical protein
MAATPSSSSSCGRPLLQMHYPRPISVLGNGVLMPSGSLLRGLFLIVWTMAWLWSMLTLSLFGYIVSGAHYVRAAFVHGAKECCSASFEFHAVLTCRDYVEDFLGNFAY